ncbi:T9SS type A sorting domain-containing protein [bacterium]|nr:T9SS type A sorting domain-containing protein [bacterium]
MSRVWWLLLLFVVVIFAQGDPHYMWGYILNDGGSIPTDTCLYYKAFVVGIPETIRYHNSDSRAVYNETNGGWSVQIGGLFPETGDTFIIFFENPCSSYAGSDTGIVELDSMTQSLGTAFLTPFIKINSKIKPQNFNLTVSPSPFNSTCRIAMQCEGECNVNIYNVLGQPVDNIFSGHLNGFKEFDWSPDNLPAGLYFVKMKTTNNSITRKVIFLP